MCGIIGLISEESTTDLLNKKRFISDGLYSDALRGMDSTGLVGIPTLLLKGNEDAQVSTRKRALAASDFLELTTTHNLISELNKFSAMIGHNRAATRGSVTNQSAHPFTHGDVTLVHNGTLVNHSYLEDVNRFTIDSEAICYALSVANNPVTVLEKLDGAFALVWYDDRTKQVNLARNTERPLSYAYAKGNKSVLLASEAKMLEWLADRNGIPLNSIEEVPVGTIVSFDPLDLSEYFETPFTPKKKVEYYNGYRGGQSEYRGASSKISVQCLKTLGLIQGETILFDPTEYVKYSQHGANNGYLSFQFKCGAERYEIRANGLRAPDWDWAPNVSTLAGEISSAYYNASLNRRIINMIKVDVASIEEEQRVRSIDDIIDDIAKKKAANTSLTIVQGGPQEKKPH